MNIVEAFYLLNVEPSCSEDEVKRAFRALASRWHPDRGGDHEAMQRLNVARDYFVSKTVEARLSEWRTLRVAGQIDAIVDKIDAEVKQWETRIAARAPVTNNESPASPATNSQSGSRRAAGWEARNVDKVREQTKARVQKHRAQNPDEYRAYMREYMRKKRSKQTVS